MVFKECFLLFLLFHVIGDFYLQTENTARKKVNKIQWVIIHGLYYWLAAMIILLPSCSWQVLSYGTIASLVHLIIDVGKFYYFRALSKNKKVTVRKEKNIFFTDQILHLLSLMIITYLYVKNVGILAINNLLSDFLKISGLSTESLVSWATALLIIHKPSNIAISKVLNIYKPLEKTSYQKNDHNAGRFIGSIERIIMLVLISLHQYSAIGLVLTAKSIARYDRISKEPDFAEYYLLGTLLSTTAAIFVSLLII